MKNILNVRADFEGTILEVGDFVGCAVVGARLPHSPSYSWLVAGFNGKLVEICVPGYKYRWRVPARVLLKIED